MKKLIAIIMMTVVFSIVNYAQDTTKQESTKKEESGQAVSNASGILYNDGKTLFASLGIKFQIEAKDDQTGVSKIYYVSDLDNNFKIYTNPFGNFITEGKHYIAYKIEDYVGNFSSIKFLEFVMDLTAPETSISTDKEVVKIGTGIYLSSKHKISLFAMDKLSGLKTLEYQINDQPFKAYTESFALTDLKTGTHRINFKATDNVGNVSSTTQYLFFLDNNAPVVNFEVEPALFVKDGKNYISTKAIIKINAEDSETGISKILFSIDGGEYKEYKYAIEKLQAGDHTIKAKAIDLVGNESQEVEFKVSVDDNSPEGKVTPLGR